MDSEKVTRKEKSSRHSKKSSKHRERDGSSSPRHDDTISKRKHMSDDEDRSDSDHEKDRKSHKRKDDRSTTKKHRHEEKSRRDKDSSPSRSKEQPASNTSSNGGQGSDELSIEETNKLREKLGLKPLQVNDNKPVTETKTSTGQVKKTYIDKDTNQEFEHMPAKNLAEIKESKTLREKLREKRERRELDEKLRKTKGIAESDEEDDAASWLQKVKEKQEAQKKAKLLEEMDEQFGTDELVESKPKEPKNTGKEYNAKNLKGLRVEHDQALFAEGKDIILTLKDRNILQGAGESLDVDNDDDADVLINVNIADDERFSKNVENKKNKPGYQAYDEFDEEGLFKEKSILDKYNEELNGEVKKSFRLDATGTFDASDQKFLEKLDEEHKAKAIRINALNELKHETDYFTPSELEKFKKPKKVRRVIRKKKDKGLKADDLLPLPTETKTEVRKRVKEVDEEGWIKKESTTEPKKKTNEEKVSIKDVDFGFEKQSDSEKESSSESDSDDDDSFKLNQNELQDYKEMADEEENALEELQAILTKTRNRLTTSNKPSNIEALVNVKEEPDEDKKGNGVEFETLDTIAEDNEHMYLDTMSEFCRNLGKASSREEKSLIYEEDDEKVEDASNAEATESKQTKPQTDSEESGESMDEDEDVINKSDQVNKSKGDSDEEFELLEDEPVLNRGLASCLNLCVNKGYIDHEKSKQHAKNADKTIEAVNFTVEEKNYYDIDDKYNRNRDRFSGPLSDFHEKSNYKPNVKLDYIDEKGHHMNEKEAFRYLSHKFHGKGSGKKKTEKQQNKYREKDIMAKMSSIDTPLNTVAMLVEKQKKLQQPFVVLSATKNKQEQ